LLALQVFRSQFNWVEDENWGKLSLLQFNWLLLQIDGSSRREIPPLLLLLLLSPSFAIIAVDHE
jgi:hypothetical protein